MRLDASIVDLKTAVVEIRAQLGEGQLSKDGALCQHRRVSLVGSFDHFDPDRALGSDRTPVDFRAITLETERS